MRRASVIRSGVVRLLVLASVMSTLVLVGGAGPAAATEPPPSFITTWGSLGTGDGQFKWHLPGRLACA